MKDLQKYARQSAKILYQYATEKNTTMVRYPIVSITEAGPFFDLILEQALTSIDGMLLQIGEAIYSEKQFKPAALDSKTKTVRFLPSDNMGEYLKVADPAKVFLVYDLRFLITRVEGWYKEYGDQIQLPTVTPTIDFNFECDPASSPEQRRAVATIFSHPFTYIWGAPGTGKTQFVLAQCLLFYAQARQPVLIVAPTNRAVEQMLYGVLPILENNEINQETVLRLGTPTKEFAARYPKICENGTLMAKIDEMTALILNLESRIQENKQKIRRLNRFNRYLISRKSFEESTERLLQAIQELSALSTELANTEQELDTFCGIHREFHRQWNDVNILISQKRAEIASLEKKLHRYESSFFRPLFVKKQAAHSLQLSETVAKLEEIQKEEALLKQKLLDIDSKKENHEKFFLQLKARKKELTILIDKSLLIIKELKLLPSTFYYSDKKISEVTTAIEKGVALFAHKEQEYADMKESSLHTLLTEQRSLEEQLDQCKKTVSRLKQEDQGRHNQILIMAATADGCLSRVLPNGSFIPRHIFLDEAGYASLIKAAALTAFHCPITLLGDHMQLPPVCEISDELIKTKEYSSVALWAQSALYLEDLFCEELPTLQQRYLEHSPPHFVHLRKNDLTHSFRFGQELAAVLAGSVYSSELKGSTSHSTEILYINAPSKMSAEKRTSLSECAAIKDYIAYHLDEEIGIITPYNNQKKLLKRFIPNDKEVNTVHGAQGREWDCVILSITDTTDKWFTNSLSPISNGKKVINTAVSRAKKRLILVCDAEYWKNQPRQLIGQLLAIAKEIQLPKQN